MSAPTRLQRWTRFALSVAGVLVLTYGILPALVDTIPTFRALADHIEAEGFETGEFFYTDVEACARAERNARATIDYPPRSAPAPR